MCLKNTPNKYGIVTKFFHWSITILICCQLYWIFCIKYLFKEGSEESIKYLVQYHKPTGVLILLLSVLGIVWRFLNVKPAFPVNMETAEKLAAKIVHTLLYLCLICMPLSGILMSVYAARTTNVFGLFIIPALAAPDKAMAHFFGLAHTYIALFLISLVVLHIAAALKHYIIDKDNVLQRMLPW